MISNRMKKRIFEGVFENDTYTDATIREDEFGKYIHYKDFSAGWSNFYFDINLAINSWDRPFDGVAYTKFSGYENETLHLFSIDGKLYTTKHIDRIYSDQIQKKVPNKSKRGYSYDISHSIRISNNNDTTETHDMTYGTRHEPKEYNIKTLSGMRQKMDILEMKPYAI